MRKRDPRTSIAEAAWHIAGTEGLESVTVRKVAERAGLSFRLVTYYFGNRDGLLTAALESLTLLRRDRLRYMALQQLGQPSSSAIQAVASTLLPQDDDHIIQIQALRAFSARGVSLAEYGSVLAADLNEHLEILTKLAQSDYRESDSKLLAKITYSVASHEAYMISVGLSTIDSARQVVEHVLSAMTSSGKRFPESES